MTGTAYFVAVLLGLLVFVLFRYPQLREPIRNFLGQRRVGIPWRDDSATLDSKAAIRKIAGAVRFECIDESVEFSHYIAVQVPKDLFHIWKDRIDKVASAVAKEVNVSGRLYAKRNRAKWVDIGPKALHYVVTEGEFLVETSFFKQAAAPSGDSFGAQGQAAFQGNDLPPMKSTVYGQDPGKWAPAPTKLVTVSVDLMVASEHVASMTLDAANPVVAVGRGRENTLVVPDAPQFEGVSASHVGVERTPEGIDVTDRSTNGTFDDQGRRLERGQPTSMTLPCVLSLAHPGNKVTLVLDWAK
ncbi:hypothetical protein BJF84_10455 [Rhodococcus sp. CUA-806]|jgi:hypothetical protein|nr:hypothetical protein BJF84_10455 [Rhodococcus sp. CUA-806]